MPSRACSPRGTVRILPLGDNRGNGRWTIRAYVSPLAPFIWLGGLVMGLGGMLSLWGRLRVRSTLPATAAQPADVLLAFAEPASADAQFEVARLPGVQESELTRVIGALREEGLLDQDGRYSYRIDKHRLEGEACGARSGQNIVKKGYK